MGAYIHGCLFSMSAYYPFKKVCHYLKKYLVKKVCACHHDLYKNGVA